MSFRTRARLGPAALVVSAVTLGGCSWLFGPSTDPTQVVANVEADKEVNPEPGNVPHPIVVRFAVLNSKDTFAGTDFPTLLYHDKQALAADLVSTDEMELQPGETRTIKIPDAKTGTVVGVLAAYYDIDNAKWREVWDLKPHEENKITVHVGIGAVTIAKTRSPGWSLWPF